MGISIYHMHPGSGARKPGMIAGATAGMRGKGDFRGMLCLFPTRTHLRHWQRRVFHKTAGECYIPPDMFTLGNFATRTARNAGHEVLDAALRPSIISALSGKGQGFSVLASLFTGELKQHFPGEEPGKIRSSLMDAFDACNIPEEISSHAQQAMDAFDAYESALNEKGYIDKEDAYGIAGDAIAGKGRVPYDTVILDGFYELTPAELLLVKGLLRAARHSFIFVPVSGQGELEYCFTNDICAEFGIVPEEVPPYMPPPEPRLNPARSRETEVEAMARHIKQRHLSGAVRELEDTLIVFPDLKAYGSTLARVMSRYGIPLDHGGIASQNYRSGPWGDLISMIRAVADGFPRLLFSRFLMSPHFRKIPSELRLRVPAAALDSGMVKGRNAWQRAVDTGSMQWVFRTLEPLLEIKACSSYERFIHALRDIMEAFVFHPGDTPPAEAMRTIERVRVCGAITGREVTLTEFADALESLLGSLEADDGGGGVEAAGIFDVRGLEPRVLYMGGLKDGDIPTRPDIDLLLPDTVKKKLGLADIERKMRLQEKIFTRLRMSAGELYMSYPSAEEDKAFLPSAFLAGIPPSPFPVPGHYCPDEAMTAWGGDSLSPQLREIELRGAYTKERTLSVTEIDAYRRCPRRFAIERLMGMCPTGISEYEMEPTELGSISHKVMERLIADRLGTYEEFAMRGREAVESALEGSGTDRFFSRLIRESILSLLPAIYELERAMQEEGFRVKDRERPLEGQPAAGISIRGKADRIDMNAEGSACIIDYKTGQASISAQALETRGEDLQLFLYAALLRDMGVRTERVGIYSLKDIAVKWVPGKRDIKKGIDMDQCIDTALSYLESTVREMRAGSFPARPISTSICNSCNEVPFCPYFQSPAQAGGPDDQ